MEHQIHHLEQEAYSAVLRAFKAQSDAISWEKEGLITELRKELRVSDDEHRELLTRVNSDDIIRRIREWRQAVGSQTARFGSSVSAHDVLHSPISASRKRQKIIQLSTQYRHDFDVPANEPAELLIGRRVWTRWPEDENFYEAVITQYNAAEGRHALVYDINTENATWEWVNLKEISPEDIRWEGEDPGIPYRGSRGGMKKGLTPSERRGRGPTKDQSKREFPPIHNGFAKETSDDIELLNTETLVKQVERVFVLSHPDPLELEKAKKMLKEHELALINAIARLADACDGESDGEQQFLNGQSMEGE